MPSLAEALRTEFNSVVRRLFVCRRIAARLVECPLGRGSHRGQFLPQAVELLLLTEHYRIQVFNSPLLKHDLLFHLADPLLEIGW